MLIQDIPKMLMELSREIASLKEQLQAIQSRPTWLTYTQAAEALGVTTETLRSKKSRREIRAQRYAGRTPLFHARYIELMAGGATEAAAWAWCESNLVGVISEQPGAGRKTVNDGRKENN